MKLFIKSLSGLILGSVLVLVGFWGAPRGVEAQVRGCSCEFLAGGTCRVKLNTNNCDVNTGPELDCSQPNPDCCSCIPNPSSGVVNTALGPNLGNNCTVDTGCAAGLTCTSGRCEVSGGGDLGTMGMRGGPLGLSGGGVSVPPSICVIEDVFGGILGFALGVVGLAAFLMFIYGGYKWLTAGTNEESVKQARMTFVWAIVGIAMAFGAWFILLFVKNFTGIDVTVLRVPGCS